MTKPRKIDVIYWIPTVLIILPGGVSGALEVFTNGPASVVQTMYALGYPLYLMKILGSAKVLGALAISTHRFPRLKEWAYAGFTFDFLGATASHILAGDPAHAPAPFVFFLLLMVSYVLWQQTQTGDAKHVGWAAPKQT